MPSNARRGGTEPAPYRKEGNTQRDRATNTQCRFEICRATPNLVSRKLKCPERPQAPKPQMPPSILGTPGRSACPAAARRVVVPYGMLLSGNTLRVLNGTRPIRPLIKGSTPRMLSVKKVYLIGRKPKYVP